MPLTSSLPAAQELAQKNTAHFPNETSRYREARNALLAEEIELRRHIEQVAELRRALPDGGAIPEDFVFDSPDGRVKFSDLFGDKETLVVYSMMFGPQRERPCPMCTAMLTSWDGMARNLRERVAIAVTARSPMQRLLDFQKERGWRFLPLVSDSSGDYTRAYVDPNDGDVPAINVFTRRNGSIHHFWAAEMNPETADPGQDPRGAPDPDPLWTVLDLTPSGRGTNWYPKLEYEKPQLTTIR